MEIRRSIETKAARIPDCVERLRFVRHAVELRQARGISAATIIGLVSTGLALVASSPANYNVPPAEGPIIQPLVIKLQPEPAKTWIVEQAGNDSVYSNGLQIRSDYTARSSASIAMNPTRPSNGNSSAACSCTTVSTPRSFRILSRRTLAVSAPQTVPAGIVFHTTESLLLPMERGQKGPLVRTREDLLRHVRDGRLYNFVIDRFGQVFRIVPEDQVAYHAGYSVWADENSIYEGLNESFLGVSFEARTGAIPEITPAQIRSGRMLTDMLRSTYDIPESNCVTHAQVSVNPDNMRFGYHTDWAANFPFRELGLSTGYNASIAAIDVFGFTYDDHFLKSIGGLPWAGLALAAQNNARAASRLNLSLTTYSSHLQQQYRSIRSRLYEHTSSSNRD